MGGNARGNVSASANSTADAAAGAELAWDSAQLAGAKPLLCYPRAMNAIDLAALAVFWVDVLLALRTAYHSTPLDVEVDGAKVAARYARTWLLPDLFSVVPYDLILAAAAAAAGRPPPSSLHLKVAKLPRLLRMRRLNETLTRAAHAGCDIVSLSLPLSPPFPSLRHHRRLHCHLGPALLLAAPLFKPIHHVGPMLSTPCHLLLAIRPVSPIIDGWGRGRRR